MITNAKIHNQAPPQLLLWKNNNDATCHPHLTSPVYNPPFCVTRFLECQISIFILYDKIRNTSLKSFHVSARYLLSEYYKYWFHINVLFLSFGNFNKDMILYKFEFKDILTDMVSCTTTTFRIYANTVLSKENLVTTWNSIFSKRHPYTLYRISYRNSIARA